MLYTEIIAVCSQIHTKHVNTLCGQNVQLLKVKLAVHIVTTGLQSVKEQHKKCNVHKSVGRCHQSPLCSPSNDQATLYIATNRCNTKSPHFLNKSHLCQQDDVIPVSHRYQPIATPVCSQTQLHIFCTLTTVFDPLSDHLQAVI